MTRRGAARWAIAGAGLALVAIGLWSWSRASELAADARVYVAATRCPAGARPGPAPCWPGVEGRIVAAAPGPALGGVPEQVVVFAPGRRVAVALAAPAPACLAPGAPVTVKTWSGRATAILGDHIRLVAAANPMRLADVFAGMTRVVLATGVCLIVLPIVWWRRSTRESSGGLAAMVRSWPGALGLAVFLFGTLADVATSVIGGAHRLAEENGLVGSVVGVLGPAGFLVTKVPAIAIAVLIAAHIPRRYAVAVLVCGGLVGIVAAVGNVHLILNLPPPRCAL